MNAKTPISAAAFINDVASVINVGVKKLAKPATMRKAIAPAMISPIRPIISIFCRLMLSPIYYSSHKSI